MTIWFKFLTIDIGYLTFKNSLAISKLIYIWDVIQLENVQLIQKILLMKFQPIHSEN